MSYTRAKQTLTWKEFKDGNFNKRPLNIMQRRNVLPLFTSNVHHIYIYIFFSFALLAVSFICFFFCFLQHHQSCQHLKKNKIATSASHESETPWLWMCLNLFRLILQQKYKTNQHFTSKSFHSDGYRHYKNQKWRNALQIIYFQQIIWKN